MVDLHMFYVSNASLKVLRHENEYKMFMTSKILIFMASNTVFLKIEIFLRVHVRLLQRKYGCLPFEWYIFLVT